MNHIQRNKHGQLDFKEKTLLDFLKLNLEQESIDFRESNFVNFSSNCFFLSSSPSSSSLLSSLSPSSFASSTLSSLPPLSRTAVFLHFILLGYFIQYLFILSIICLFCVFQQWSIQCHLSAPSLFNVFIFE